MSFGSLQNDSMASLLLLVFAPAGALCFVFVVENWRQSILRRIARLERQTNVHESWLSAILKSFFIENKDKSDGVKK